MRKEKNGGRGVLTKTLKSDFSDIPANFPFILTDLSFWNLMNYQFYPKAALQVAGQVFFSEKKTHSKTERYGNTIVWGDLAQT